VGMVMVAIGWTLACCFLACFWRDINCICDQDSVQAQWEGNATKARGLD